MKNALIDNVPAEFYDTQVYNDFSFVIINAINNAFTECDDLLKQNGHNKYHNLVAIFYHHLTRLLTSYVFCKYEIDDAKIRLDNRLIDLQSTTDHKYIWPINYSSVNNSNFELIGHEYKNIWPSTGLFRWFIKSNYKKIITIFNKLSPDFGIGRILLSANSGINPKSLTDTGYNIRMMDTNTKVFIANFSEQVDILLKLIKSS